jgi:RNA-directed DNA polymerase
MRMLKERIVDRTILRLIGKWLKAGVMEEGEKLGNDVGVPQGGVISPLLANISLHYVLDLWVMRKVIKELAGKIYLIRYADDFVIGCTDREDAQKVWEMLQDRLKQFGLELSPENSRMRKIRKSDSVRGRGQQIHG